MTEEHKNLLTKALPKIKIILIAGIVFMILMVLVGYLYPLAKKLADAPTEVEVNEELLAQISKARSTRSSKYYQQQETDIQPETQLPITIEFAENIFFSEDYEKAYTAYDILYNNIPEENHNELLAGFLRLRIGQCLLSDDNFDEAQNYLSAAAQCKSPIVKTFANYYLATTYLNLENWLDARAAAYRAIAAADIPDNNVNWAQSLKLNSHLIVAQVVTRYALTLYDADKYDASQMWKQLEKVEDPFLKLNEKQLSLFLTSGMEKIRPSISSPIISKNLIVNPDDLTTYNITCESAPVEGLIARFAQNSDAQISFQSVQGSANLNARQQNITLYMPEATVDDFVITAAGAAGLLAQIEDNVVTIKDLGYYSSITEYAKLLSDEAVQLWRRQAFMGDNDDQRPGAHFALALLYGKNNQTAEAIAEYKLITNRFINSVFAEYSLLNSAKLKAGMHDYPGAQTDLEYLVEQYPDTETSQDGLLYLADLTMQTQNFKKASRLYNKVYYFSTDTQTRAKAALGAGNCFSEMQDFEVAADWMDKYLQQARIIRDPQRYSKSYMLGKIYLKLGEKEKAFESLEAAITGNLKKDDYLDAITLLVNGYIEQNEYIKALNVLESDQISFASNNYAAELLLLKSSLLRSMGIIDDNIRTLKLRLERLVNPELRAKTLFELGLCYKEKGDVELARNTFVEAFENSEVGPVSNQIAWQIAETCLELKQYRQAVLMCEHILKLNTDDQLNAKARKLMAAAYMDEKNYNSALAALINK